MSLNLNFANTQPNYDESFAGGNYDPIPEDWYPTVITAAQNKSTKDRSGHYLQFDLEVVEGEYKGRKLWARMNYDNKSAKAVEIAGKQLANFAHATGVLEINESTLQQFVGKMLDVHTYIEPATEQYKAKNEIDQYRPAGGVASTAPVQNSATAQAAPAGGTKPAWAK